MIEISTPTLGLNQVTTNLFYYQNSTDRIQIIRVEQAIFQPFEKVIFPGEQTLFYSTSKASLDVYIGTSTGLTLVNRVPCSQLQVFETEA